MYEVLDEFFIFIFVCKIKFLRLIECEVEDLGLKFIIDKGIYKVF